MFVLRHGFAMILLSRMFWFLMNLHFTYTIVAVDLLPHSRCVLSIYLFELSSSNIAGYYNHFPPKSMNVSVSPNGKNEQTHILIAEKDFKAGDEIYEVSDILWLESRSLCCRKSHSSLL